MKKHCFLFVLMIAVISCENTYIETYEEQAPIITEFAPLEGSVGTEITILGENLQRVDSVFIGGVAAPIRYRISGSKLVAEVVSGNRSGQIRVVNIAGEATSTEHFTVHYAVPTITQCPAEGTVNAEMVVEGTNLQFVERVLLGENEATIIAQRETELVFKVPYVDEEKAVDLSFAYYDGEKTNTIPSGLFTIMLQAPIVRYCPLSLTKYLPVTIQGEFLGLVDALYVGEQPLVIKIQSDEEITFDMPTNYFGGNMTGDLTAVYYGEKRLLILQDFQIYADPNEPRYYKYENILLSARANYGGTENSFFDCESGTVISSCDAASNMGIIDFFLYDQAGYVQLYSPHNAANTVKNFKCEGKTIDPQDGTWKSFYDAELGTKTCFRVLKPEVEAEKAIIDAFEAGTIIDLDTAFFSGLTEPSTKAPRIYRSANDNGYSNSHLSLDQYPYAWVRNFTTGKNGIIKVTAMPKEATNGRIPELQFDIIWGK